MILHLLLYKANFTVHCSDFSNLLHSEFICTEQAATRAVSAVALVKSPSCAVAALLQKPCLLHFKKPQRGSCIKFCKFTLGASDFVNSFSLTGFHATLHVSPWTTKTPGWFSRLAQGIRLTLFLSPHPIQQTQLTDQGSWQRRRTGGKKVLMQTRPIYRQVGRPPSTT